MSEPEREPPPKPPFDLVKASFYLVAGVIATHLTIVTIVTVWCLADYDKVVAAGRHCDPEGRLTEILAAALAAALAFAGGRMRNGNGRK